MISEFAKWCQTNGSEIGGFGYIHHHWSQWEDFIQESHLVAYNIEGDALQCGRFRWAEPLALANVQRFVDTLRRSLGLK